MMGWGKAAGRRDSAATAQVNTDRGIWYEMSRDRYYVIKGGGVVALGDTWSFVSEQLLDDSQLEHQLPSDPSEYNLDLSTGTGIWYDAASRRFQVLISGVPHARRHATLLSARSALRAAHG